MAGFEAQNIIIPIDELNKPRLITTDARPNTGAGIAAPLTSVAMVIVDGTVAETWRKEGALDTDWVQLTSAEFVSATIGHIDSGETTSTVGYLYDPNNSASFDFLQDAIDAVNALGGGYIFIKSGTYNFNDVVANGNYRISGEGVSNTILDGVNGGSITFTGDAFISDLQIGSVTNRVDAPLIFDGGGNVMVKNVKTYAVTNGISIVKTDGGGEFVDFENLFADGGDEVIEIDDLTNSNYAISIRNSYIYTTVKGLVAGGTYGKLSIHSTSFVANGANVVDLVELTDNAELSSVVFEQCVFEIDTSATFSTSAVYLIDPTNGFTKINNLLFLSNIFNLPSVNLFTVTARVSNFFFNNNTSLASGKFFYYPEAVTPGTPTLANIIINDNSFAAFGDIWFDIDDQQLDIYNLSINGNSFALANIGSPRPTSKFARILFRGDSIFNGNISNNSAIAVDIIGFTLDLNIVNNNIAGPAFGVLSFQVLGVQGTLNINANKITRSSATSGPLVNVGSNPITAVTQAMALFFSQNELNNGESNGGPIMRLNTETARVNNNTFFRPTPSDGDYDFVLDDALDTIIMGTAFDGVGNTLSNMNVFYMDVNGTTSQVRAIYNDLAGAVPGPLGNELDAVVTFGETVPNVWPGTNWNEGTYVP